MKEPIVSIKMITYNHAPFIAQAIEGVLQQKTDYPFELVIGEDCSTDGTREIVLEYQNKYPNIIRVITSDINVGMRKNGYRTTKACRGKYMAYCEGDDYWHRMDKLQKQIAYLESHPECGLVYSDYDICYVNSKKRIANYIKSRKWQMPDNPSVSDFVEAKGGMFLGILTCTTIVRRSLCEKVIDSDPYLHQSTQFMRGDTQLWAEIATISKVHFMPESYSTYNQTGESATRSKNLTKTPRLQIADAELHLYLCSKYNLPLCLRDEIQARKYNGMLRLAFHEKNEKLADEARSKKKTLNLKEWLLYYGAKNMSFQYPVRLVVLSRNICRKAMKEWL